MNRGEIQSRVGRLAVLRASLLTSGVFAGVTFSARLHAQQPAARAAAVPAARAASPAPQALVFQDIAVIDVEAGRAVPGQTVVIEGNRVRAVGSTGQTAVPPGAQVVDAHGKYLMPGLWDMHTHMGPVDPTTLLRHLIATGVTGIRDMERPVSVPQLRQEMAAGTRVGPPRIVWTAGMLELDGDGGAEPRGTFVPDPDTARKVIRNFKAAGADFVKIHSHLMSRETYFAVAAEARKLGIPFAGHLPFNVSLIEASDSGQRSIEHINEFPSTCIIANSGWSRQEPFDEKACAELGERFRRNDTWFTPTLVIADSFPHTQDPYGRYISGEIFPGTEDERVWALTDGEVLVDAVNKVGIPLLAGTDGLTSIHRELAMLAESGLTPLEALRTATINPAKFLHATDSLGTVAQGKLADLVLLDADPLTDIANTAKIRAVVADGRYFDRAALDALLDSPR